MTAEVFRDAPNRAHLAARLLVGELARAGVGLFVVQPGSRSTPLATAVQALKRPHLVHYDERGGAFAALGYARAIGRPACWITTSGTAVANGLPAAVEADADGVPLVLLTADRPVELRDTGANQTIRQPDLFAPYARWRADLPAPTLDVPAAFWLTTADQAVARAAGAPRGPVHLNMAFREPLSLKREPEADRFGKHLQGLDAWIEGSAPYTRYALPPADAEPELDAILTGFRDARGVVVAGRLDTLEDGEAALALAERLGWPLLPDTCSGLRLSHARHPLVCPHYDLALAHAPTAGRLRPEAAVYVGGRATSKRLKTWLAAARPDPFVVVRPDPFRFDPDHLVTHRVAGRLKGGSLQEPDSVSEWARAWKEASDAAGRAAAEALDSRDALSEPGVARATAASVPEGGGLVLAASMPVRDVDGFASAEGPARVLVTANRGASGIDGTVATAAGFALGLQEPVTLLIGDLALLHDLNSLALLKGEGVPPVTVVAVNNDGGGIFHFLPIAGGPGALPDDTFEPLFGTPHGLGFRHAAQMFGIAYYAPDSVPALKAVLQEPAPGPRLVEVRTDRAANRAFHAELLERIRAALS